MTDLAATVEIAANNYRVARAAYEQSGWAEHEAEYTRTFQELQQARDEYWMAQPLHDRTIRNMAYWEASDDWLFKWERGNNLAVERIDVMETK